MSENGSQFNCHYPVTRWSLVGRAGGAASDEQRAALDELLSRYLPALEAHLIRYKRIAPELAEDLLHDFVYDKILQNNLISRANRTRGKFRSFLLVSLERFVISESRRENARKKALRAWVEAGSDKAIGPDNASDDGFHAAWARQTISESLRRMKVECEESGRSDLWGIFQLRILAPILEDSEPLPYEELVRCYGLQSPLQACNLLITAKRMFTRNLQAVVGEYSCDAGEAKEEIEELRKILANSHA